MPDICSATQLMRAIDTDPTPVAADAAPTPANVPGTIRMVAVGFPLALLKWVSPNETAAAGDSINIGVYALDGILGVFEKIATFNNVLEDQVITLETLQQSQLAIIIEAVSAGFAGTTVDFYVRGLPK